MQYQHEDMNNHRWNVTTPTSSSTVNQDITTSASNTTSLSTSSSSSSSNNNDVNCAPNIINNLTNTNNNNNIIDNTQNLIEQNNNNNNTTTTASTTIIPSVSASGGNLTPTRNGNSNTTTISTSPIQNLKSPLTTQSVITDSVIDNNSQTKHNNIYSNHHLQQLQLKAESPLNSTIISSSSSSSSSSGIGTISTASTTSINNTISAPADSSDNQPSTPQPSNNILTSSSNPNTSNTVGNLNLLGHQAPIYSTLPPHQYGGQHLHHPHHPAHHSQSLITSNQEMHPYPSYMHGYDQFYHPPPPPATMDYASSGTLYPPSAASQQSAAVVAAAAASAAAASATGGGLQDYKSLVPPTRYHPYLPNGTSQISQTPQSGTATNNGNNNTNPSSSISNSSLSPRVVSSSSPTQNSLIGQQPQSSQDSSGLNGSSLNQSASGQPDPSTTPKQCDKCGFVCSTDILLNEHYNSVHGGPPTSSMSEPLRTPGTPSVNDENSIANQQQQTSQTQYPYQQPTYPKDDNGSDILDLDSQKMVYPPQHDPLGQEQTLPPMNSMHPMHRPLMWGSEMHGSGNYMPQPPEMNKPYYPNPMKQGYPVIKSEYGVPMKATDFPSSSGFTGQMIKADYHQSITPQSRPDMKGFGNEIPNVNNPVSSSPSEFPTTTNPQENGPQFRGFEPPTTTLSGNPNVVKATTWKSNEARRPKTYNCTACNKWFTSSGHLKRHYNTTLHKNAVKSSGQPDPATMPISAHHHPSRDPNHKSNRRNNAHSQQPPPPPPPEPPRSPEYTSQYTPPPSGFSQQSQFQSFSQQMNTGVHSTTQQNSASNGHPNGQAGPSVQASQPRGLLIISSTMEQQINSNNLEQEDQVHSSQMPNSPREGIYHHNQDNRQSDLMLATTNSPSRSNSNNPHLHPDQHHHQQDLQEQQQLLQLRQQQQSHLPTHIISHHRGPIREDYRLPHQGIPMPSVTSPTIHSTTIHHNTIMDHQQPHQYISPLAINTTSPTIHTTSTIIPSYQLQQQQAEHQSYHTIIDDGRWQYPSSYDYYSSPSSYNAKPSYYCGSSTYIGGRNNHHITRKSNSSLLASCT
ncbi:mucin-2 isoform X2 [Condylostylus longicornis]|uniref:mucin-2 isoform X2 n=1 Tax=Condylostylus longicornis TaxID=2530218 RepID=UPI00244DBBDE|nr:mucin-2 isoform X2 [Condylostylus longicornis]